jgi:type II secretory pathway pseudopilin PulG
MHHRDTLRARLSAHEGYLMVALLVAMSIMAIMMSAALPAWHTLAQREKEAELVFRGEQYARAIGLYQRRVANAQPPSIDFLVEQRFLRKKYKDPITNDDFQIVTSASAVSLPGQAGTQQAQGGGRAAGAGRGSTSGLATGGLSSAPGGVIGGIIGVTSKSPLKSLRLYNNRDTDNEWLVVPGAQGRAGAAGAGPGGGRGGDGRGGDGRGGRGVDGRGGDGRGGRGGRGGLDELFPRGGGGGQGGGRGPGGGNGRGGRF